MKKILLSSILLAFVIALNAQDNTKTPQEDKKQLKERVFQNENEALIKMANDRNIVLEATALYGRHGFNAFNVSPNNYISIDSNRFTLQTSNTNSIGQNGLGGVTVRGEITSYEVMPGKGKRPVTVIAQVRTYGFGFATVTLRLTGLKNSQATFMTGQTTLTLSGPITTKEESYVYKGIDTY